MECTYDEPPDPVEIHSQSKLEALEAKINSLESVLKGSTAALPPDVPFDYSRSESPLGNLVPVPPISRPALHASSTPVAGPSTTIHEHIVLTNLLENIVHQELPANSNNNSELNGIPLVIAPPDIPLLPPHWPEYIPPPDLLQHLVETFFTSLPHARRLIHYDTFMTSLTQPADSPSFPAAALLHAICAISSFYTTVIEAPPPPDVTSLPSEELFPKSRFRISENPTFGDIHALWSELTGIKAWEYGNRTLQCAQARVIMSWYYYTAGDKLSMWSMSGKSCRTVLPTAINVSAPYASLSRTNQTPSILAPAGNVVDEEERRNLFWLIYILERLQSAETRWAMLLDDEDISQYLPLTDEDFAEGREHPSTLRRQRIASPNMLFTHPPESTSPFSLLIKSVILLGKVKTFNVRFRNKYAETEYEHDPRSTAEFRELNQLVSGFREGWPKEWRERADAVVGEGGKVDATLYLAALLPSVAMIMLHDPHVDFSRPTCPSSKRILESIDVIMASIYKLSNAGVDLLLLDHWSSYCWLVAGMALVRVLKAKLDAKAHIEAIKVNAEIEIVKHILLNLGKRTIIGRRQIRLLADFHDSEVGTAGASSKSSSLSSTMAVFSPSTDLATMPASSVGGPLKKTVAEMLGITNPRPVSPPPPTFDNIDQWANWNPA